MQPPICFVCHQRFDPDHGARVTFQESSAGAAWSERAPGVVGHPPDLGWFCGDHADAAHALAPDHIIGDALVKLRQQ